MHRTSTSSPTSEAAFPRTTGALAADRSFRVVLLAVVGAAALGAWIFWAARGGVDLVEGRGRRADGPRGGGSGDRSERPASP